ncbi:MAG: flagellar motor stator protein MotA [Acidobacteriota bacterium]
MFAIIGIVVVTVAVLGGFAMAGGPFLVLVQPSEFVVICGAALGAVLIGNPPTVLKLMAQRLPAIFTGGAYHKQAYLELLTMLYELFNKARKDGLIGLEEEVMKPDSSQIFSRYPAFLKNHLAMDFLCDTLKLMINGVTDTHEIEKAMDAELETHHQEGGLAPGILSKMGDGLPGLGIVAAVLGIIITMQSMDGPPEEIGHHVAAALVGTFLGVLLSYGYIQPLSTQLEHMAHEESKYLECIKAAIISFAGGANPVVAVEFARKIIYSFNRPTNAEMEEACKQAKLANAA